MGTKFEVTNTGLVKFKQNGTEQFVFENGTSTPVSGVEGQTYYRTDTDQLLIHDGSIFKATLGGSFRIYGEGPNETPNGAITVFSVDNAYVATTTQVTRDGLVMKLGDDYTESAPHLGQITFAVAPATSSVITISYSRVEGSALPLMSKFNVVVGTPVSTYSGSTTVFDLPFAYTPAAGSLLVWSAGVLMLVGGANDYVETDGNTVTFNSARTVGEVIQFIKIGAANDQATSGWVDAGTDVVLQTSTDLVGIGTSSPSSYNSNARTLVVASSSGNSGITIRAATNGENNIGFSDTENTTLSGRIGYNHNATATAELMTFRVGTVDSFFINGNSQALLSNGSAALPSLTFNSDPDTGFYNNAVNQVTLSLGGTAAWRWEGSVNYPVSDNTTIIGAISNRPLAIYMGDGAAGTPAYTFGADANTGIWRGAADDMRISTGGVTRLRIQNTAVDTEAAQHRFTDGSAASPALTFISDTDTGIYRDATNRLGIAAGGSKIADFRATTTADSVDHLPFSFFGGTSFGGGAAGVNFFVRTTASVSTTPVDIGGTAYGLLIVTGVTSGGATTFVDVLVDAYSTTPIVIANRENGSPTARTYSISGDRLLLAMASGTYSVATTTMSVPIR